MTKFSFLKSTLVQLTRLGFRNDDVKCQKRERSRMPQ